MSSSVAEDVSPTLRAVPESVLSARSRPVRAGYVQVGHDEAGEAKMVPLPGQFGDGKGLWPGRRSGAAATAGRAELLLSSRTRWIRSRQLACD